MSTSAEANPAPGFEKHPNYEVKISPLNQEISIEVDGVSIGRSRRGIELIETKHRPVWYLPLGDLDQSLTKPTDTQTYCPFKGSASYWSIVLPQATVEDAIWAYLTPYDECLGIAEYASFYTNKVDLKIDGQLMNKDGPGWVK